MPKVREEILLKDGSKVQCNVQQRANARHLTLRVKNNQIYLTKPPRVSRQTYHAFIKENTEWLLKNIEPSAEASSNEVQNRIGYLENKIAAKRLAKQRLEHFNKHYNFKYERVIIRDQSSRWGSCSTNLTLSFNYRINLLPPELLDYIIVHELCHLREMNHSKRFWDLVAECVPNHKYLRRKLRKFEKSLF